MKKIKLSFGKVLIILIVLGYSLALVFNPASVIPALKYSWNVFWSIIPLLFLALTFMIVADYFFSPRWLKKQLGNEAGIKKWIIAIAAGILAVGPSFIWYPMLQDLKRHGIGDDILVSFLYCKAINIQFFPMMIYYFGLKYLIVITVLMIISSVLQGMIFKFAEKKNFCSAVVS